LAERQRIRANKRFLEVERPQIYEKLDFGEIVRRQIDRCLMNAADEITFAYHVLALEALIPSTNLSDDYLNELEESVQTVQYAYPVINCGIPVNPDVLREQVQETEEIDWHRRFTAAINLFEALGITWKRVPTTAF